MGATGVSTFNHGSTSEPQKCRILYMPSFSGMLSIAAASLGPSPSALICARGVMYERTQKMMALERGKAVRVWCSTRR